MSGHVFAFSLSWRDGKRLCKECGEKYDDGDHAEIHPLKPHTSYICPNDGDGRGHRSVWSGSQDVPELRSPRDKFCSCGAEYVEQDDETWRLSWEIQHPRSLEWQDLAVERSRHASHQQRDGLLTLIEQGELIRNVELVQIVKAENRRDRLSQEEKAAIWDEGYAQGVRDGRPGVTGAGPVLDNPYLRDDAAS